MIIAYYTFIEYVRKKILYIIFGIGAILMLATVIAGWLALSEQAKVIRDFSIWLIEIAWLVLVLFFGSNVLYQEISQNTIFLLASKNINRKNIILWKFFWFSAIIRLFIVIMWLLYVFISLLYHVPLWRIHILAILGIAIKLQVLLAICLFFASFVSPFVTLFVSLVIYLLSHIMGFVVFYITVLKKDIFSPFITSITQIFYYIFPNFTALSIQDFFDVPFLGHVLWQSFWFAVVFNLLYIIIILFFATRLFTKKQL